MSIIAKGKITKEDYDCNKYSLPMMYLDELYEMMKNIANLFERNKIVYFADGGTMLGIHRESYQIRYDNDIDFGCFREGFDKILNLKEEIEKRFDYQFTLYEKYMIKIFSKKVCIQPTEDEKLLIFPCIDILEYTRIGKAESGLIIIKDKLFRSQYPKAYHLEKHLFPLIYGNYGTIGKPYVRIPMPYKPEFYLKRLYGENCLEERIVYVKDYAK